jgi:hypothetical protein
MRYSESSNPDTNILKILIGIKNVDPEPGLKNCDRNIILTLNNVKIIPVPYLTIYLNFKMLYLGSGEDDLPAHKYQKNNPENMKTLTNI